MTKSPVEDDMPAMVRAGGLTDPEVNVSVVRGRPRPGPGAEERGFEVMRFTREQVKKQGEWILVRLAQLRRSSRTVD